MMFYSKSSGGFYDANVCGENIPADAVEITADQHSALLVGQSHGKQIVGDDNGQPVLIELPIVELTYAQKRRLEYPPMQDYLDGVVKGDKTQIDAYIAACLAVKAKYPKPE